MKPYKKSFENFEIMKIKKIHMIITKNENIKHFNENHETNETHINLYNY